MKVRILMLTVTSARCQDLACNVLKINEPPEGTAHLTLRFLSSHKHRLSKCLLARARPSLGYVTTGCNNEGGGDLCHDDEMKE